MKTLKIILGILAIIPIGLIIASIADRTQSQIHAIIHLHSPREPESPEDPSTASITLTPVGAPLHTRSIMLEYAVRQKNRPDH